MKFPLVRPRGSRNCLAALLALALAPAQVAAVGTATEPVPLVIGESFTIASDILDETRRITVYAAPAYGESPEARRPVLYMPDGGLAEDFLHVAGLFAVESFLLEPDLFDTVIAIDPSLWWNGQELVNGAAARLDAQPELQGGLYLASSDEEGIANVVLGLSGLLAAHAPAGLRWVHAPMPAEKHLTIYHPGALLAFRAILGPMSGP